MSEPAQPVLTQSLALPGEHGALHGTLNLLPAAQGIVVLAHMTQALDARDGKFAEHFQHAGFSTLNVDLLARQEEHFPDVQHHVPLLSRRLLDFLGQLRHRMQMGEIAPQPLGLFATGPASPVIIRTAALRDHDIGAIVCCGGLIDLAGVLYLRSLESPLLMLVEDSEPQHIANTRRALQEVPCTKEFKILPPSGANEERSSDVKPIAQLAIQWFMHNLRTNAE